MKWYIVQAFSQYENRVKEALEKRIEQYDMGHLFGEILVPKEQVQRAVDGQKRQYSRNFYPGYIFVQMHLSEEAWHLVKDTPKVSGFIGGRRPSPVPRREIEVVKSQMETGKRVAQVSFDKGDHVRVIEGPFSNYSGSIEEINAEKQKVRVLISIFGRATPVELDFDQVEKTS